MRVFGHRYQIDRAEIARHVNLDALPAGTDVRAFVIAHEGEMRPVDRDTGQLKVLQWGGAAVRRAAALARSGVQFLAGHLDRQPVGEVLGSWTDTIAGKLSAIVAARFEPGAADEARFCSLEASGVRDIAGWVADLGSIDAVALIKPGERPAMPGAALQGAIYAFTGAGVDNAGGDADDKGMAEEGKPRPISIRDVRNWLEDNPGVRPGQLFKDEAILEHPAVAAKVDEVTGKLTKSEAKVTSLGTEIARGKARTAVEAKMGEWTPEAKAYAGAAFDSWAEATDNPAKVTEWLGSAAEKFKAATGKDAFTPKGEGEQQQGGGQQQTTQTPPAQPNTPPVAPKDPVAAANELLGITTKAA